MDLKTNMDFICVLVDNQWSRNIKMIVGPGPKYHVDDRQKRGKGVLGMCPVPHERKAETYII